MHKATITSCDFMVQSNMVAPYFYKVLELIMEIKNYNVYLGEMDKSLFDKSFFIDKVFGVSCIVDWGCANGSLVKFLQGVYPSNTYIGYDIDPNMIDIASRNTDIVFTNNIDEVRSFIDKERSLLNLSSVIHEVYSYCNDAEIALFWDNVFSMESKYISIRDMCMSSSAHRPSQPDDIVKVFNKYDNKKIGEFESNFGLITDNYNMIHFLSKYRYVANWDREVRENYFPLTLDEFISKIPASYEIVYFEHFLLPFLKNTIYNDFGVVINDNTHIKLILKRVK